MTRATDRSRPLRTEQQRHAAAGGRQDTAALDCAAIMQSAGEIPYEWRLDTDALNWGAGAARMFGLRNTAEIATGRGFATLLDSATATTRFDAIARSAEADMGAGIPYQLQYALRAGPRSPDLWIEDTGRWFAGPDGKPCKAHGVIRAINDRHEREQKLAYLSRFDVLSGEINRWHLTEKLNRVSARRGTDTDVLRVPACRDRQSRAHQRAYGYDVADEVIGVIAKRLRGRMRGLDIIGRFSGNKFGIILKDCTPDEIGIAAERFLTVIRNDVVHDDRRSGLGHRHHRRGRSRRAMPPMSTRFLRAPRKHSTPPRAGGLARFWPIIPISNARRSARANIRATDRSSNALNERRILLAYEPVVDAQSREIAFHECLLRIRENRRHACTGRRDHSGCGAARSCPHARSARARTGDRGNGRASRISRASLNVSASSTMDPDWWSQLEIVAAAA